MKLSKFPSALEEYISLKKIMLRLVIKKEDEGKAG